MVPWVGKKRDDRAKASWLCREKTRGGSIERNGFRLMVQHFQDLRDQMEESGNKKVPSCGKRKKRKKDTKTLNLISTPTILQVMYSFTGNFVQDIR